MTRAYAACRLQFSRGDVAERDRISSYFKSDYHLHTNGVLLLHCGISKRGRSGALMEASAQFSKDQDGRNLTGRIVHDLGRAIVTHRYTSHAPFPYEAELCLQFGASRSVVREAVKMLTAKGLLIARQRKGTVVRSENDWNLMDPDVIRWMLEREFSIDLLVDFTEMRLAIEPRAAGLAAHTATGHQRRAILTAIDRMFAAERGSDDPLESDIDFHVSVLQASNNRFVRQFKDLTEATLRFSIRRTNDYKGVSRASAVEHKAVADAIVAGDPQLASANMRTLIGGALDLLVQAGSGRTEAAS